MLGLKNATLLVVESLGDSLEVTHQAWFALLLKKENKLS